MTLPASSKCRGSSMRLVPRAYTIRKIEEADRERNASRIARSLAPGDADEAGVIQRGFERRQFARAFTNPIREFVNGLASARRDHPVGPWLLDCVDVISVNRQECPKSKESRLPDEGIAQT